MCEHSVFLHLLWIDGVLRFHRLVVPAVGRRGGFRDSESCCRRPFCMPAAGRRTVVRQLIYNKVAATTGLPVFQALHGGFQKKPCLHRKEALFAMQRSLVWRQKKPCLEKRGKRLLI